MQPHDPADPASGPGPGPGRRDEPADEPGPDATASPPDRPAGLDYVFRIAPADPRRDLDFEDVADK